MIIGFFPLLGFVTEPPAILTSERRAPAKLPVFSAKTVISGEFADKFESYAADNIPLRERLRTLRAAAVFGVFMQTDKDGLYFTPEGAGKFAALDSASVELAADKIKRVADGLSDMNVYYSFIPDKSIYIKARRFPGFDPAEAERIMTSRLSSDEFTFIPLTNALGIGDYYKTDLHWDQTKISGVTSALGAAMGVEVDMSGCTTLYAGEFFGVYAGQVALPTGSDSMYYISFPGLTAEYLNEKTLAAESAPVYDVEGFSGVDPYDIFLRGAQPLVVLENKNAATERELYLFRDSFSSSLAPLLASAYSKVVLIDLRYLDSRLLDQYIEFVPGSDVLFLFSSQILNNSSVLRA
ncbi:MAG: hypothetical protein FWG32_01945 [Oscillospiraceae bacterium]|nr:hypothetical protein [Oscillospiraceae bacterium]